MKVKARQLTKETVTQMRRYVLMLVGEVEHLEYHSVQLQLADKIASIVRCYGLNTTVRTLWSTDHSIDDVSLYLCYVSQRDIYLLGPLQRRRAQGTTL